MARTPPRPQALRRPVSEPPAGVSSFQIVSFFSVLREVKTLDEFVAMTGELSLYIGRMDYWVDLLIPWAKFGETYEQTRQ